MDKRVWKRDVARDRCAHCPAWQDGCVWKLHAQREKLSGSAVPKALILVQFHTLALFEYKIIWSFDSD